jgi:hypothetical protein
VGAAQISGLQILHARGSGVLATGVTGVVIQVTKGLSLHSIP